MVFRFGELFCGPGGLALGALNARATGGKGEEFYLEHAFANDISGAHVHQVYLSAGNKNSTNATVIACTHDGS